MPSDSQLFLWLKTNNYFESAYAYCSLFDLRGKLSKDTLNCNKILKITAQLSHHRLQSIMIRCGPCNSCIIDDWICADAIAKSIRSFQAKEGR